VAANRPNAENNPTGADLGVICLPGMSSASFGCLRMCPTYASWKASKGLFDVRAWCSFRRSCSPSKMLHSLMRLQVGLMDIGKASS
jgi:hypothetical protein